MQITRFNFKFLAGFILTHINFKFSTNCLHVLFNALVNQYDNIHSALLKELVLMRWGVLVADYLTNDDIIALYNNIAAMKIMYGGFILHSVNFFMSMYAVFCCF